MSLKLKLLPGRFMISRVDEAPTEADFWAIIHDHDGWTLIERRDLGNWRAIQIDQEFGLDEVGILLQILQPLAESQVPVMAYSTYKTDYVFVKQSNSSAAVDVLIAAGHEVSGV